MKSHVPQAIPMRVQATDSWPPGTQPMGLYCWCPQLGATNAPMTKRLTLKLDHTCLRMLQQTC